MNLDALGLGHKEFRALRAQGLQTVQNVLEAGPEAFAKRKKMWSELSEALRKVANHRPNQAEEIATFLKAGDELSEAHHSARAEQRATDPDAGLPPDERALLRVLRRTNTPKPLRRLRREAFPDGRFRAVKTIVRSSQNLLLYPYGLHNWIGLKEWGLEGYLKAAKGAWNVLPVYLPSVLGDSEKPLEPAALEAITTIALERNDKEVLTLCQPHLPPDPLEEDEPGTEEDESSAPSPVEEPPHETPVARTAEAPVSDPETNRRNLTDLIRERAKQRQVAESAQPTLRSRVAQALAGEDPRIFANLAPDGDLRKAMDSILRHSQSLPKPFALAEVKPTAGDWMWLKDWARTIRPFQVRSWFQSQDFLSTDGKWSLSESFGVLLLFLVSEEARRRGQEGRIWTVVPSFFADETREELFADGQPRFQTREAIETGARRLQVHHAFGREGRQSWYLTAFLQFGFTRQKIPQLPLWLTREDQLTESCYQLLEESRSFRGLWQALRRYRADPALVEETRVALENNTFVERDWIPEILVAAKRQLSDETLDQATDGLPLVSKATIVWSPPEEPRWALSYYELDFHGLTDSVYDVEVGGEVVGRIFQQSDGTFAADPPHLDGPLETPGIELDFLSELGEDDRDERVVLWEEGDDVVVFDVRNGNRREPTGLSTNRAYIVVVKKSLRLEPSSAAHASVQDRDLYYLSEGWSEATYVQDQAGETVLKLAAEPRPNWLEAVSLGDAAGKHKLGDQATFTLMNLPPRVTVEWARFQGELLEVRSSAKGHQVRLTLPPHLTGPTVSVRFCVQENGVRYRFRCPAKVPIFDASILLKNESWQRFDSLPQLNASELSSAHCRFFLHHEEWKSPRDWAIMEGKSFAHRPSGRIAKLKRPAGFGAALSLIQGPYNSDTPLPHTLVQSVVQQGIVVGLTRWNSDWTLWLDQSLTADEDHQVVLWGNSGAFAVLEPDQLDQCDGLVWKGKLPDCFQSDEPLSAALAFRGGSLGSAWEEGFQVHWRQPDFRRTANLVRWFRHPLLAPDWEAGAREFARAHPLSSLLAWLLDRKVDGFPSLSLPAESDDWFGVVRQVFYQWQPDPQQASAIWNGLLLEMKEARLLFNLLLQVDPALTLKITTKGTFSKGELKMFQQWAALSKNKDDLAKDAARDMRAGDYYMPLRICENFIKGRLDERGKRNLETAIQVGAFSRLLTVMYLEHHISQLRS